MIHTGQHYDSKMSDIFFNEMKIKEPKYNLGIGGGSHGQNTGRMIKKIEEVLIKEEPDWIILYGDTDSTLAGAIASSKLKCKVAHVEAGLRSFNRNMPEEINRILTDHASDLLFTPTINASEQLLKEGVSEEKIKFVGDVMYDATLAFTEIAKDLDINILDSEGYILLTLHRAENVDNKEKLQDIIQAINECPYKVIFPVHPRTKKRLSEFGIQLDNNIIQIDPVGYLEMLMLEKNALAVATDSGGVQKEAYFQGKPCIVLREETEWIELVELGNNKLVGSDTDKIKSALDELKNSDTIEKVDLYGDGKASLKITNHLNNWVR
jgi:UDP-GlcNAc3NAcA epimerase